MGKNHISPGLFFIASGVGIGGFFIANTSVKYLSTSAWISVAMGLLLCVIPCVLIKLSERRTGKDSVFEILEEKTLVCAVFKIALSLLFVGLTVFLCAYFSGIINSSILSGVSRTVISGGLCVLLFLSLFKQRVSVLRTAVLICFFCGISVVAVRLLIVFGGENVKLLPLFEKERIGFGGLRAAWAVFGVFSAAALLMYTFARRVSTAAATVGLLGNALIFVLLISSCIVLLGAEQTADFADAMVLAMRRSDLLGRGDILFFTVWMFFIASSFVSSGFAPKAVINRGMEYPWFIYFLYSVLIFLLTLAANRLKNLTEILIYILFAGCGGMFCFLAAAVFIISLSHKRREG